MKIIYQSKNVIRIVVERGITVRGIGLDRGPAAADMVESDGAKAIPEMRDLMGPHLLGRPETVQE
jgi:hypothetical protein